MTPEQKSQELIDKFKPHVFVSEYANDPEKEETENAKQCAIICVDEMLIYCNARFEEFNTDFWQKVKQAIQNA